MPTAFAPMYHSTHQVYIRSFSRVLFSHRNKGISVAIASFHDFTETFYPAATITKTLELLREGGMSDMAKMAIKTPTPSQVHAHPLNNRILSPAKFTYKLKQRPLSKVSEMNFAISRFTEAHKMPAIGLCMGAAGAISRVTNDFLSFSTHPLMPGASAPGQLVSTEVKTVPRTALIHTA